MAAMKYILLAEDNPADIFMLKKCLNSALSIEHEIVEAKNGEEAIKSLEDSPDVNLIILDLNMPVLDGHEVLKQFKSGDKTKHIPIIVLTSSDNLSDIKKAYANHANCYIQKARNLDGFKSICSRINEFWIQTAVLPD